MKKIAVVAAVIKHEDKFYVYKEHHLNMIIFL